LDPGHRTPRANLLIEAKLACCNLKLFTLAQRGCRAKRGEWGVEGDLLVQLCNFPRISPDNNAREAKTFRPYTNVTMAFKFPFKWWQ